MSVLDFDTKERTVHLGGRSFVVKRPTIVAVIRFLVLFQGEIDRVLELREERPALWDVDPIGNALTVVFSASQERLVEVAQLIARSHEDPQTWPAKELLVLSLDGCDLPRIVDSIFNVEPSSDVERALEHDLCDIGDYFSLDPVVIANTWPWETYLSVREILGEKAERQKNKQGTNGKTMRFNLLNFPTLPGVARG